MVGHKATFSRGRVQCHLHLAQGDPIDFLLWIFAKICYKSNVISTNILLYGEIISQLLLQQEVAPQAEEWLAEQISLFNITQHEAGPTPNLVPLTQTMVGVDTHSQTSREHPFGTTGEACPAWVDTIMSEITTQIDGHFDAHIGPLHTSLKDKSFSIGQHLDILNDKGQYIGKQVS